MRRAHANDGRRRAPQSCRGIPAEGGGAGAGVGRPLGKAEAAEIVRSQIERITLTPGEDGGLEVELYGDLARILQLCEAGERTHKRPRTNVPGRHALGRLSVVAGAGFEPATFRL